MIRYSVQPRDKGYWYFSFVKNMGKNIGKNISKNLSGRYTEKLLDHTKQSATESFKIAPKRVNQKTAGATGYLIVDKTSYRSTSISKKSQQNNSETVTNEHDKEIPKERHISPEETQKFIDDLILI